MPHLLEADRVGSIIGAFTRCTTTTGPAWRSRFTRARWSEELRHREHGVVREVAVNVEYDGVHVAWQRLDLVVDNRIIVEIKAGELLPRYAERQLISYLKATQFEVGVLLHFGERATFRRFIDSPKRIRRAILEIRSNSRDSNASTALSAIRRVSVGTNRHTNRHEFDEFHESAQ